MIVSGKNATKVAIYLILSGASLLIMGRYLLFLDSNGLDGYWLGVGIAAILMALLFGHSYRFGKRRLTEKRKKNAHKAAASARYGWFWAFIGIFCLPLILLHVIKRDLSERAEPALFGGFGTVSLLMGVTILLDNFWIKAIFLWNNSDPDIRKLWGGKS